MSPDTASAGPYPIPAWIVDTLPHELWRPGRGLFMAFGVLGYFDVDIIAGRPIRTIRYAGRSSARVAMTSSSLTIAMPKAIPESTGAIVYFWPSA